MFDYTHLAFAYDDLSITGSIKNAPEDFKVEELLGFELTGEGEHLFLQIEKRGLNTEELVKAVARRVNCSAKAISYAGLKDRQAVATQWLSIHIPGKEIIDADFLAGEGWRVLASKRHLKKLKTGALLGNSFQLVVRDISLSTECEKRLQQIKKTGVPNYFGTQRFGFSGQNLAKAEQFLLKGLKVKDRFLKGIYYSAARAFLFNLVLSARVKEDAWNKPLAGDVMQLAGTNSLFSLESPDELILKRVHEFDISPAASLWGVGKELLSTKALAIQESALREYQDWCFALEQHKLNRAYRGQVLQVKDMRWQWADQCTLMLSFKLAAGSYATSVIRELVQVL